MLHTHEDEESSDDAATREGHDSEDGALAPDSIVAEGLDDLDAPEGWRFAWPLAGGFGWLFA